MRIAYPRPLSSRPKVSVVIPCYRYGHYLPAAVASALDQEGVDVEVIIVDDASPDDSADIAEHLSRTDNRVSVIRHHENRGHIATYNDGLACATGEFVTLVSADDFLTPGALARAVALMTANPRVGFVYGRPIEFSGAPPIDQNRSPYTWSIWPGHRWLRLSCRRGRNFILSPEVVMRTEALRAVGDYRADLPHSGDLELWLRTAGHWDVGRINGPAQAYYRVHDSNMHLTTFAGLSFDLLQRHRAFQTVQASPLANRARFTTTADAALATQALTAACHLLDQGERRDVVQPLIDVAAEIYPPIMQTRLHTKVDQHQAQRRITALFCSRVVESIRWRIWRQVGVS